MAAITTGLSALLYMCASSRLSKSEVINYLIYDNSYDRSRYTSSFPNERSYATDIANSLGYDIVFHGPYSWWCPPIYERTATTKVTFTQPTIKAESLNHISFNALFFLDKVLTGTQVEIFPEGASCFSVFGSLDTRHNYWERHLRPRLASMKRYLSRRQYHVTKTWLLPDRLGKVRASTRGLFSTDVFDENCFYTSLQACSLFFATKYKGFDYSNFTSKICFHPLLESLSEPHYDSWLKELLFNTDDCLLLVKPKPRMAETRIPSAIKRLKHLTVPDKYLKLPGELILEQLQHTRYLGYLSSMLLGFHEDSMTLVPPPDLHLKRIYDESYAGLKAVLGI